MAESDASIRIAVETDISAARKEFKRLNDAAAKAADKVEYLGNKITQLTREKASGHFKVFDEATAGIKTTETALTAAKAKLDEFKQTLGSNATTFGKYYNAIKDGAWGGNIRDPNARIARTQALVSGQLARSGLSEQFQQYAKLRGDVDRLTFSLSGFEAQAGSAEQAINSIVANDPDIKKLTVEFEKADQAVDLLSRQADGAADELERLLTLRGDIDKKLLSGSFVDDPKAEELGRRYTEAYDRVQALKLAYKDRGEGYAGKGDYAEALAELKEAENELKKYYELKRRDTELPQPTYFENLVSGATTANAEVRKLSEELSKLSQLKKDYEYAFGFAPQGVKQYDDAVNRIREIVDEIRRIQSPETKAGLDFSDAFSSLSNSARKAFGYIKRTFGKLYSILVSPIQKASRLMSSFGKRLKTAILQGLVFRPIRTALFNFVSSIGTLLKSNEDLSKSFAQVKGAALTAFQPLLTAVVPIIQKVCQWIIQLISYITALLRLFFKIGDASRDAAKAMYDQANATKAGGSAADKFLASWDTIQKISSSSGGGADTTSPDFDFDVDTDKLGKFEEFIGKLKEKISLNDWYGVGMEISAKFNEIITAFNTKFPELDKIIKNGAKNLADLLNGLFDGWDAKKSGNTLGSLINTVVETALTFFTTSKQERWGQKVGKFISSAIKTINWQNFVEAINMAVKKLFDFIASVVKNIDPKSFNSALDAVLSGIVELIGIIFKGMKRVLGSHFAEAIALAFTVMNIKIWQRPVSLALTKAMKTFVKSPAFISAMKITAGISLVVTGAAVSYSAGFSIGRGTAGFLDTVKAVLGPIAGGVGGALIGSTIFPGVGTVIGAISGVLIGVIFELVGKFNGKKQALLDAYYQSEAYQAVEGLKIEIERNNETIEGIKLNLDGITGEVSADDLATLQQAQDLIDEIFSLDDIEIKTPEQIAELNSKIDLLNGLNLDGIHAEFDTLTGKITTSKEALEQQMATLLESYKLEAYRDAITEAYKQQAQAEQVLSVAKQTERDAIKNMQTAMSDLTAARDAENEAIEKRLELLSRYQTLSADEIEWLNNYKTKQQELTDKVKEQELAYADAKEAYQLALQSLQDSYGIYDEATEKVDYLKDAFVDCYKSIYENTPNAGDATDSFMQAIIDGIVDNTDATENAAIGVAAAIMGAFEQDLSESSAEGVTSSFVSKIAQTLQDTMGVPADKAEELAQNLYSSLTAVQNGDGFSEEDAKIAAKNFVDGLVNGIDENTSIGEDALSDFAAAVIKAFNDAAGIHSPADTTEESGKNLVLGLKNGIENNQQLAVSAMQTMLEQMQTKVDAFVSNCISAINGMLQQMSDTLTSVKVTAGGSISYTAAKGVNMPKFAQGGVVNPGHEFAAILGDNRYEQEVVSPLSTMKEALMEALAESGYNRGGNITMQIDGKTFARITNPYLQKEQNRIGISVVGGSA